MEKPNVENRVSEGVRIPEDFNFFIFSEDGEELNDRRQALEILGLAEDANNTEIYKKLKLRLAVGIDSLRNLAECEVWYIDGEWKPFPREFREGEQTENLDRAMQHFGLNPHTATKTELRWAIKCDYPELPEGWRYHCKTDGQIDLYVYERNKRNFSEAKVLKVIKFNTAETSKEISSIQDEVKGSV